LIPFWHGVKSGSPTPLHNPLVDLDESGARSESEIVVAHAEMNQGDNKLPNAPLKNSLSKIASQKNA
jgi:hypothetical protein